MQSRPHLNKLPDEIFAEILFLCTPLMPELYEDSMPADLLPVCRRWRDVALATARLWSSFQFVLYYDGRHLKLPEIVSTWIRRSHHLPVSITANMDPEADVESLLDPDQEANRQAFDKVTQAICDVSARWNRIEVDLPSEYAQRVIEASEASGTPCSKLTVNFILGGRGWPNLRKKLADIPDITLFRVFLTIQELATLPSIRNLDIDCLTNAGSCIQLIAHCPNLEKLCLKFNGREMEYRGGAVLARSLTWMNLGFETDVDHQRRLASVFQKVTAPSITTLCLTEQFDSHPQLSYLKEFISRSECALKRFYYCGRTSSDNLGMLVDICKMSPSLEAVDICIGADWRQLVEFLSGFADVQHLPLLRTFTFGLDDEFCDERIKQPLRDFAERRCLRNGGKMEKITLQKHEIEGLPPPEVFFDGLHDMGIEFDLEDSWLSSLVCGGWDQE